MRLSRRSDYALRALVSLAAAKDPRPVSVRILARDHDIPARFLEQIMVDLREQGIVRSVPGRVGGFVLAKPPEEITLGQVIRFFDGVLAPVGCVSLTQYEACSQEAVCHFRRIFLLIRNFTADALDHATLAEVVKARPVTEREVQSMKLTEGAGI